MKVFFDTNDKSKKDFYEYGFKMGNKDIECFSIKDEELVNKMKFKVTMDDFEEENDSNDYLTVSIKESLFIDGLSDENQPGALYNMPKILFDDISEEKKVSDLDVVNYYASVVEKLGGSANAKFIDEVTISYRGKEIKKFAIENEATFTSKASKVIKKGNPLKSLMLIPEFGDIHFSECDDSDREILYETRDKKNLKIIAKEIEEVKRIYDDMNSKEKDFLNNEIKI